MELEESLYGKNSNEIFGRLVAVPLSQASYPPRDSAGGEDLAAQRIWAQGV